MLYYGQLIQTTVVYDSPINSSIHTFLIQDFEKFYYLFSLGLSANMKQVRPDFPLMLKQRVVYTAIKVSSNACSALLKKSH